MQGKFVCVFALVALVIMSFTEVDACRRCGCDSCGCGSSGGGSIIAPMPQLLPQPLSLSVIDGGNSCGGCGSYYDGPSYLPRRYCGGCLSRKLYRLQSSCC
ncbi:uncharacterized protein LOC107272811 [Cephus cinctus]|uniref:Uncharacterized protein LOC107272811 n=1 Tax=Cephus cinctus TaxID=211228 RepID=A0AAJ7CAA4_CEPCN|nr:uncharacterized protein LOC107272811 [Cephus cinctus]